MDGNKKWYALHSLFSFFFFLVVVEVAHLVVVDVKDVADGDLLPQAHGVELGVERQGRAVLAGRGAPADAAHAGVVLDLPLAPHAVDERVVHEEDRVAGRGRDLGHDGADAVVSVGVRAKKRNALVRPGQSRRRGEGGGGCVKNKCIGRYKTHPISLQLSMSE